MPILEHDYTSDAKIEPSRIIKPNSLMAVARFRNVLLGQILYAGDDLSGENWVKHGWESRKEVRESLFGLAADACLEM